MATDISKKDQLLMAIKDSNWKKALGIAKSFRRDFNDEEEKVIQIAHETFSSESRTNFYKGLGLDTKECLNKAIEALEKWNEIHKPEM